MSNEMENNELLIVISVAFYAYGVSIFTYQFVLWGFGLFDKKIKRNLLAKKLYKATFTEKKSYDTVILCDDEFTIMIVREENEKHGKQEAI